MTASMIVELLGVFLLNRAKAQMYCSIVFYLPSMQELFGIMEVQLRRTDNLSVF